MFKLAVPGKLWLSSKLWRVTCCRYKLVWELRLKTQSVRL